MLVVQRLLRALVAVALLVTAFVIMSVLLAVVAVVALVAWAWIWSRTRKLPRRRAPGDVINGEYRVERETRIEHNVRCCGDDAPLCDP